MKVGVVGLGYVGLSTAVCFATKFPTVGIDKNSGRVADLKAGKVPIHEKGLGTLLKKGASRRRLSFSTSTDALAGCDLIFIAVGTPSNPDGSIDLSQVNSASLDIASQMSKSAKKPLVMVRSTVVPGTARDLVRQSIERASGRRCGEGFLLCSNPEFLREGTAIQDSLRPERLVLGGFDKASSAAARSFYRRFYGKKAPAIVETTLEGAELIKYASNSFLATRLSLINLMAAACELYSGTDVNDVAKGVGLDPRIGRLFLQAGPGFGGSCFPKDLKAFAAYLRQVALDSSILEGVIKVNEFQPEHVVALAEKKAGGLSGKEVAVLGLAFKADTNDVRESRSLAVVEGLLRRGATVRVYDPAAMGEAKSVLGSKVTYSASVVACLNGAEVAIAMTAWRELRGLKPAVFSKTMKTPVLIDARRMYDPEEYSKKLDYLAVGRGSSGQ